jgi:rRNA maturation endonuclease Nob1
MLLGFLGFLLIFLALLRLLAKMPTPTKKTTLTVIQCTKCAFKSIRNFQVGDYIPKIVGTCPSCGGPFQIEAIYVEEKPPKKKSPEPF